MSWNRLFTTLRRAAPANAQASAGRMTVRAPVPKPSGLRQEIIAAAIGVTAALGLGGVLMTLHASAEACFTITSILGLFGVLIYEVMTRRVWEAGIVNRLDRSEAGQDRLARAVARTENDIETLKDGLAETATALEAQAKRLPAAAASIETRMLDVIAQRLGILGKKAAPKMKIIKDDQIVELTVAPPARQTIESRMDRAFDSRGGKYSDKALAELLRNAVLHDRIEMFMQPVVSLPQRKVKMIEMLARVPAGNGFLPAERYMQVAANDTLLPAIDDLLLLQCLDSLTDPRHAIPDDVPCILNIDARTLRDTGFLNDLVTFLKRHRAMASRLVLELSQADLEALHGAALPVLQGLVKLGCRFSMDRVRKRKLNVAQMKALPIRFLKLDAAWLVQEASQQGGASRINQLKKRLDAAGIDLIVKRIESEKQMRDLLDFNIDYGQGHLFAKPEPFAAWRGRQLQAKSGRVA